MNKVKRIILKTILVITAVLGIYLMFFQTKGTEKTSREDETKIRQEQYRASCKKLALWTVQHYSGIKSIEFWGYSDYGEGGKAISADINSNSTLTFTYYVNGIKLDGNKPLDMMISFDNDGWEKTVFEREDKSATLKNVKVTYTWEGKLNNE